MKLRNNKGYVMTDASIAIIILLILVPTIMGLVYAVNVTRRTTEAKTDAINIVTNVIEAAKGISLDDNYDGEAILSSLKAEQGDIYYEQMGDITNEEINEKTLPTAVIEMDKAKYKVYVDVVDYADVEGHTEAARNIVKTVTATVKYKVGGQEKEISLSTVVK